MPLRDVFDFPRHRQARRGLLRPCRGGNLDDERIHGLRMRSTRGYLPAPHPGRQCDLVPTPHASAVRIFLNLQSQRHLLDCERSPACRFLRFLMMTPSLCHARGKSAESNSPMIPHPMMLAVQMAVTRYLRRGSRIALAATIAPEP